MVNGGFQNYTTLTQWLDERGYQLSRSSVQRYGKNLQAEFEQVMADVHKTTQIARTFSQNEEDSHGSLIDATARIMQEQLLRITIALRQAEHDPGQAARHMASVTHALADIGRMSLTQKKWSREVRSEVAKEAARRATAIAKKGGLSSDVVNDLRRELLGIAQ